MGTDDPKDEGRVRGDGRKAENVDLAVRDVEELVSKVGVDTQSGASLLGSVPREGEVELVGFRDIRVEGLGDHVVVEEHLEAGSGEYGMKA